LQWCVSKYVHKVYGDDSAIYRELEQKKRREITSCKKSDTENKSKVSITSTVISSISQFGGKSTDSKTEYSQQANVQFHGKASEDNCCNFNIVEYKQKTTRLKN